MRGYILQVIKISFLNSYCVPTFRTLTEIIHHLVKWLLPAIICEMNNLSYRKRSRLCRLSPKVGIDFDVDLVQIRDEAV